MAISKDLSHLIGQFKNLDSKRDSINDKQERVAKRTRLQNFFGFMIYILTFGLRAKNPQLDQGTKKSIACAELLFKTPQLTAAEKSDLICAFTTLKTIVEQNGGSQQKSLLSLIKKLQILQPISSQKAPPSPSQNLFPQPPQHILAPASAHNLPVQAVLQGVPINGHLTPYPSDIRLSQALESYWNTLKNCISSELAPVPQLQQAGQEIVALLPQVDSLAPSTTDPSCLHLALTHAIVNSDRKWPQNLLPKLSFAFLQMFVSQSLLASEDSICTRVLLSGLCQGLQLLPKDHSLVHAFMLGFPSPVHLPAIGANRNYYRRLGAIHDALNHREHVNGNDAKISRQLMQFVKMEEFKQLVNHLDQAQAAPLLQNIFRYVGNLIHEPVSQEDHLKPMLDLADYFPPYRRVILEGLSYSRDVSYLARICQHEGIDADIVAGILTRNPPDAFDRCANQNERDNFGPDREPFYTDFMSKLKAHHALQVKVILFILKDSEYRYDGAKQAKLMALVKNAPPKVWQEVGRALSFYVSHDQIDALTSSLSHAAIAALVNGMAENSYPSSKLYINALLLEMPRPDLWTQISERALGMVEFERPLKKAEHKATHKLDHFPLYYLMHALRNPSDPQEKRLIRSLAKEIYKHQQLSKMAGYFISYLTVEQAQQLPLEQLPKSVVFLLKVLFKPLAQNRENLRDLYLALNGKENKDFEILYSSIGMPDRVEFLSLLWEQTEDKSTPLADTLLTSILQHPFVNELLQLPRPILMRNLKRIDQLDTRCELLLHFQDQEARQALDIWWDTIDFTSRGPVWLDLGRTKFPFARMISLTEDPVKVIKMVSYTYCYSRHRQVLEELEKTPWKLLTSIHHINLVVLKHWFKGQTNRTGNYPKCSQIWEWYIATGSSNIVEWNVANGTFLEAPLDQIHNGLKKSLEAKDWRAAFDCVDQAEDDIKRCFLSAVWGPSPEGLAKACRSLTDGQLFAALFNQEARENLQKAILTGAATEDQFIALNKLIENLLAQPSNLPKEARKVVTDFKDNICRAVNPWGNTYLACNSAYTDLLLTTSKGAVRVHSPLLQLDPFFHAFPITGALDNKVMTVPKEKDAEANQRIGWLYNTLPFQMLLSMPGQKLIAKPLSLTPLLDNPASLPDWRIVVEGKEIKAHRFILASALPFFAGAFSSGMREAREGKIVMEGYTYQQIFQVIKAAYNGKMPDFGQDKKSQADFYQAYKYLNVQ